MNLSEKILIFSLIILGSVSILVWIISGVMAFNTTGIALIGLGLGFYLGMRALYL